MTHCMSAWRTSSHSNGTNCVEVGFTGHLRAVRDTKDREGGCLTVNAAQWSTFVTAIKTGRYDS